MVCRKDLVLAHYSLICNNDMSPAVKYNHFLYGDDTCLVWQQKDINEIEKQLNQDF